MNEVYKEITIDGIRYNLVPIKEERVFNDWRLPTIQELKTLVNYNKINPACDLEDTKSKCYWSSTPHVSNSHAWQVDFGYGGDVTNRKEVRLLVRCVRDGENGLEWSATSENTMTWDETLEYANNLVAPVYYKDKQ